MKKLIYIPIVHNQADLGSLGSQLSAEGERKYGREAWREHLENVDKSWGDIETGLLKLLKKTATGNIRIFQDGLPVAGEIGFKIVKEAAESGSRNYLIIDRLLSRGAMLETAENKELLLKEYYLLAEIKKADTPEKQIEAYLTYQRMSKELLNLRDDFIATRINQTLKDGETGVAFFGAAHNVIDKLDKNIKVNILKMFVDEISLNLVAKNQPSPI